MKTWLTTYDVTVIGGFLTIGGADCVNSNFRSFLESQSEELHAHPAKIGVFDIGGRQYVWVIWESW